MPQIANPALLPEAHAAACRALETETQAVNQAAVRNDEALRHALELLCHLGQGRIIVSGLGKSGHIGAKMAATFSSFGAPAYFMNSSEALHGDFGMCTPHDVGILISYSGRTAEVLAVARWMKDFGMKLIVMSREPTSPLGQLADVHLDIAVEREADPLNLGPTASTVATLALGDALGAGLQILNEFTPQDFHLRHPGGTLGSLLSTAEAQ